MAHYRDAARWRRYWLQFWFVGWCLVAQIPHAAADQPARASEEEQIALSLAEMLRDANSVVSDNQALINNPDVGDKGLSGPVVRDLAVQIYRRHTGVDPTGLDPESRQGRLLRVMMGAISEAMEANQATINQKGVGFKGFIPAVFARFVDGAFNRLANGEATMKFTAPPELVRNRKALPDSWEATVIKTRLADPAWPHGHPYSAEIDVKGRPAYRLMAPEYYVDSCLACHGPTKGEMDITGYPKEGGRLGDLGGVISIILYR